MYIYLCTRQGLRSPAPAAMCMGGGLSIVLGLRELRLEGLAADERVLVGHAADDGLAPVPHQGIPDGDDSGGDGGRVDVVPTRSPRMSSKNRSAAPGDELWSPNASA